MRTPTIIGLDVDEVLAQLHDPWIAWGNREFGTQHRHFLDWNDPVEWWGKACYQFLTPGIYDDDIVKPFDGARAAVDALRELGHEMRFVTSCSPGSESAKFQWLVRHGFLLETDEFIPGKDKSKAHCHVLVDDGYHNVSSFQGWGVLVTRPHNELEPWQHRINHVKDLLAYC